ncbi:deoxyguanosinetriphosphate triphosphohydrolase [Stappia taiwanensis]|uniref:Deoxyguanosinetriphosphate triphosphohydrolase-like protein n=1 Tax=Stappia taiwanensis TaxID=992267 RepID=A0A838Y2Q5_9HYPH|nr:deoxyguanosinetriphosphate triphosphohydrolase [Stappia taiwanensis]MBA4613273.1 deoxyguanosinetriphosphate triphosphohydrolase [Stappia taiwanensis]GGE80771.1 deoxyguanosinetriphosphate triphosphohydrolase-like protein [Stappia taiwanensis]
MTAPLGYGAQPRAPFATNPDKSHGRLFPEPESPTRTPFQRDRDRIIHSTAFRRLKHKTQVFVYHEGDHFRTRLTHTIEVSQIARSLARALRLDEDLAECLALAHDLGHTPFGHEGEDVMDACMAPYGGFDHNAQSLRVVTSLERRYAEFDGLNLSWETLEGLVKHNGPLVGPDGAPLGKFAGSELPFAIRAHSQRQDLRLDTWPSAEAQAAAIADDIAYDAHDLDDGLRAGLLRIEQIREVPFFASILDEVDARYPNLEEPRRIHEIVRRSITRMVEDVIREAVTRIAAAAPASVEDVRAAPGALVAFSAEMARAEGEVKAFLFANLYRHPDVLAVRRKVSQVTRELFEAYFADPALMPEEWRRGLEDAATDRRARRVCDFIAGMTDRFAMDEHRRLFDHTPDLG